MVIDGNSDSDYYHNKVNLKKVVDTAISDTQNKTVRIMNLFPSTLSTNYYYKNLNKIDNNYIASLIEWVLKQPSDIELRDVIIYPSERENFKKTLL
jgi:NADP-dependent 3-hydroxy acid dehydrogenase YdfG